MADRGEPPYDPYIPSGNNAPAGGAQAVNNRTAALQAVGSHSLFVLRFVHVRPRGNTASRGGSSSRVQDDDTMALQYLLATLLRAV